MNALLDSFEAAHGGPLWVRLVLLVPFIALSIGVGAFVAVEGVVLFLRGAK